MDICIKKSYLKKLYTITSEDPSGGLTSRLATYDLRDNGNMYTTQS